MTTTTEPNSGIFTNENFTSGQSGWASNTVANYKRMGRIGFHLTIKDRDLTAPPGSPANGDTYIPLAPATGAWAGHENKVVVYEIATTSWIIYTPREGWTAYVSDEDVLIGHTGSAWTTGVALTETAHADQATVTLGNTNSEISALTFSATPTQAEAEALRDKCEELADDVRALSVLLHRIRTDLITFGVIKGSA